MKTKSYSPKLTEHSKYYKTFSNILQIRTISAEYLVAMKLMAGRQYKNDFSDIIGILIEQNKRGNALSLNKIKEAICDLYDSYDRIPENSRKFIESIYEMENLTEFYNRYKMLEQENRNDLLEFQNNYPGVLNDDNLASVLKAAKSKRGSE